MPLTVEAAQAALAKVRYPGLAESLVELGRVRDLAVEGDTATVTVQLATPVEPARAALEDEVRRALAAAGAKKVELTFGVTMRKRTILPDDPCPGVANIILVMSGKGG